MASIGAVHHVSLTVTDLEASANWYRELFGLATMMEEKHDGGRAIVLADFESGLFLGLHQHDGGGGRFDERRTGLDHLSLSVGSRQELLDWEQRLAAMGIASSPISDQPWGSILVLRDPDNIQLELCSPPATA